MTTILKFEDIESWQNAREITSLVYNFTKHEQFARDFGVCDQMRRSAVSIMSNIAEGFESRTKILFKDYLGSAKASAGELRAQAYVAHDNGYINQEEFSKLYELCDKCSRQIARFIDYLIHQPHAVRDDGIEYNV